MRRVRRPLARARRRAPHVLRALRAAAPWPGVRGDRRRRRHAGHRRPRDGPRTARVRRGEALRAARRGRDRPYPLLDDGRRPLVERPAGRAPRRRAHGRARAQREPRRPDAAPRRAARRGRAARDDLRHRGDRRAPRERPVAAPGGGRRDDAQAERRLLGRRDRGRDARRLPRPPRHPAPDARPHRRRLRARLGDLRARPRRGRDGARRPARRGGLDRRRRLPPRAGRAARA